MFKQREHKRFNYKSRFDNDGNREEKHSSKNNVTSNIELLKRPARKSKTVKLPLLLILLVILIVMMYYLDNIMN